MGRYFMKMRKLCGISLYLFKRSCYVEYSFFVAALLRMKYGRYHVPAPACNETPRNTKQYLNTHLGPE